MFDNIHKSLHYFNHFFFVIFFFRSLFSNCFVSLPSTEGLSHGLSISEEDDLVVAVSTEYNCKEAASAVCCLDEFSSPVGEGESLLSVVNESLVAVLMDLCRSRELSAATCGFLDESSFSADEGEELLVLALSTVNELLDGVLTELGGSRELGAVGCGCLDESSLRETALSARDAALTAGYSTREMNQQSSFTRCGS